jgi:hypothetical protein
MRKLTQRELFLIENGMGVNIDGVRIWFRWENNTLIVTGWSNYTNLDFLRKEEAIRELNLIKETALELIKSNKELQKPFDKIEFHLALSEGTASIIVCEEVDNKIIWNY